MSYLQEVVSEVKQSKSVIGFEQTAKLHPIGRRQLIVSNKQFLQRLVKFHSSNCSSTNNKC